MDRIFGWSYPPGVSASDIDRHFGADCDNDEDECPHGDHCSACCDDCEDDRRVDAADQRADAIREREA